jgi:hypothetical protein
MALPAKSAKHTTSLLAPDLFRAARDAHLASVLKQTSSHNDAVTGHNWQVDDEMVTPVIVEDDVSSAANAGKRLRQGTVEGLASRLIADRDSQRYLVRAAAGHGKGFVAKKVVHEVAKRLTAEEPSAGEGLVPLHIDLPRLASARTVLANPPEDSQEAAALERITERATRAAGAAAAVSPVRASPLSPARASGVGVALLLRAVGVDAPGDAPNTARWMMLIQAFEAGRLVLVVDGYGEDGIEASQRPAIDSFLLYVLLPSANRLLLLGRSEAIALSRCARLGLSALRLQPFSVEQLPQLMSQAPAEDQA